MTLPPLLITSSVGVFAPFTSLQDPSLRVVYTMDALEKWAAIPELKIVICDGSNFDYSPLVGARFPQASIECLAFENDQEKVARLGKGFGEGEIVKYALANSKFLAESDHFAKITAKLFVRNFAEILDVWNGRFLCDCLFKPVHQFWLGVRIFGVDTKFYVSSKRVYIDTFLNAHYGVDDNLHKSIEGEFATAIMRSGMRSVIMPFKPIIEGVSGTNSLPYAIEPRTLASRVERWAVAAQSRFIAKPSLI